MKSIIAVGNLFGKETEIICVETDDEEHIFLIDRGEDKTVEKIIKDKMKKVYPIAGTFVPDEHSMLNIKNVLEFHIFEKLISLDVHGDIGELPFEEGKIY